MKRVFDKDKKNELAEYDLASGYLRDERLFVAHHEAVEGRAAEQYSTVIDRNGEKVGALVKIPEVYPREAWDEYEDILVYEPYDEEELERRKRDELRRRRTDECFAVVDRGRLWYDSLTPEQLNELRRWYIAWLNVTETMEAPVRPEWVDGKIENSEEVL